MMKNNNIKEIFGKNLKFLRKKKNITQEVFAEKIGIETSNLSKIECGKSYPRPETFDKIVEILGVKPYVLFINENDIDIETAYKEAVEKLEILKNKPELFKRAYDFICELSK